jgi:Protein of unknown function (DUF4244)
MHPDPHLPTVITGPWPEPSPGLAPDHAPHGSADRFRRLRWPRRLRRLQWLRRLRRDSRRLHESGMATAEYAIATLAACGFAALLLAILRSGEVRGLLLGIIRRALAVN